MTSVPTAWNRSSSTPKATHSGRLLRGLRPCGPSIRLHGDGSTNAPLTFRTRIDNGRVCRTVKKEFEGSFVLRLGAT